MSTVRFPTKLDGSFQYNMTGNSNMLTYRKPSGELYQVAIYIADDRKAYVAERRFPDGEFSRPYIVSNATGSGTVDGDSHNNAAIGIDPNGYFYVADDHHVDPLNMARSNQPYSITGGWTNVPRSVMGSKDTDRVTYPEFFTHRGDLCFSYREQNHAKVNGKTAPFFLWLLKKLDPKTGKWSTMIQVNTTDWVRMYVSNIAEDNRGRLHLCGMWRDEKNGGNADTQHDLFHIMSEDGRNWTYIDGEKAKLPFSYDHNTKEGSQTQLIWDTSKGDPKTFNMLSITTDSNGMPHMIIPDRQKRWYYVRYQGGKWVTTKLGLASNSTMQVYASGTTVGAISNHGTTTTIHWISKNGAFKLGTGKTDSRSKVQIDRTAEKMGFISLLLTKGKELLPRNGTPAVSVDGYIVTEKLVNSPSVPDIPPPAQPVPPLPVPPGEVATAVGNTLGEARELFDLTFGRAKRVDCDERSDGTWICSSEDVTDAQKDVGPAPGGTPTPEPTPETPPEPAQEAVLIATLVPLLEALATTLRASAETIDTITNTIRGN